MEKYVTMINMMMSSTIFFVFLAAFWRRWQGSPEGQRPSGSLILLGAQRTKVS